MLGGLSEGNYPCFKLGISSFHFMKAPEVNFSDISLSIRKQYASLLTDLTKHYKTLLWLICYIVPIPYFPSL